MRYLSLVVLLLLVPATAAAQYFGFGKNRVQYGAHDWYFVQSKHFDVYYYDEDGRYLADFTARAAEDAYDKIRVQFDHEISERIAILVYKSHNDFAVTNAVQLPDYSEGIGGVTELFKNRVAIPFTGDYRDYRRVVHHELIHAVVNDMFYGGSIQSIIQNNIQLRIPLWFNEGIAEYSAQGWDTQSDMYLRDAITNDYLAPIRFLNGFFAYRGGQGVWDYIVEQYGEEKIGEIMQRLRLSRNVESAFQRSLGLSLDELSDRWHDALKKVYWPEVAAREDLDDIAKLVIDRDKGFYNTSPAISPKGDKIAFITTKDGLFDVFVANANDGRNLRKLIDGQDNTQFESLKILTPGLTWNPEGTKVALAVKSGPTDAIAVVDVKTKEAMHYRIPDIDAILTVSWSPNGKHIAFSATNEAQSDLYVLDLEAEQTTNVTNDLFSDHEPAWAPDSKSLVFHSDRGDYTVLGRYTEGTFNMLEHDYTQYEVYRVMLGAQSAERLTFNELWDDASPKFGDDPERILFISDRNGIPNLYEKNLTTGMERPLTNVLVGITQVSLSADGRKAALVSLNEGTQSIFMLKTPFDRTYEEPMLQPNVWAQRVMQDKVEPAPSVALASSTNLQQNPILRDAADGVPYMRTIPGQVAAIASSTDLVEPGEADARTGLQGADVAPADTGQVAIARVDFSNYVFSSAFDEVNEDVPDEFVNPFEPTDNEAEDGKLKQKRYRLSFSPDIITGTAGYDALYGGVQGVTQMSFSDVLGNHQIYAATNLLIDLRNSDYLLAYSYLPERIDWTVSAFHTARVLPQFQLNTYVRYRYFGGGVSASYPLDKFRRVDANMGFTSVSQTDIGDPRNPTVSRTFLSPSLTYTKDVTIPGFLYPQSGTRYAISLSGSPGWFAGDVLQFGTVLADWRHYKSLGGPYQLALRASGAASFGRNQQLFYTSGVSNWINRDFDDVNGFPITDVSDFVFATPVLPLRGGLINSRNGSYFGLVNAEFRFPLIAALLPGPVPLIPLYNIQGAAFIDAGSVWGGRSTDSDFDLFTRNANGERVFDDLLVGAGFGVRTILLGFPLRLDWAWQHDGQGFRDRQFYVSVGLDF